MPIYYTDPKDDYPYIKIIDRGDNLLKEVWVEGHILSSEVISYRVNTPPAILFNSIWIKFIESIKRKSQQENAKGRFDKVDINLEDQTEEKEIPINTNGNK